MCAESEFQVYVNRALAVGVCTTLTPERAAGRLAAAIPKWAYVLDDAKGFQPSVSHYEDGRPVWDRSAAPAPCPTAPETHTHHIFRRNGLAKEAPHA